MRELQCELFYFVSKMQFYKVIKLDRTDEVF